MIKGFWYQKWFECIAEHFLSVIQNRSFTLFVSEIQRFFCLFMSYENFTKWLLEIPISIPHFIDNKFA